MGNRHARGHERGRVYPEHRLPMALPSEGFSATQQVHNYFIWWHGDGVLDRIHHALVECREKAERDASPTTCIIDSQSVKSAEKGGLH